MAFDYDAGESTKQREELKKKYSSSQWDKRVEFKATLEGQRALKDGGLNVTLGLSEDEYVGVAKLLAMRGFVLNVTVVPEIEKTYGGK